MVVDFKIFKHKKSVSQSAYLDDDCWCLSSDKKFDKKPYLDKINGLIYNENTESQILLYFVSKEKAIDFVKSLGHTFVLLPENNHVRLKPKSYQDNFL